MLQNVSSPAFRTINRAYNSVFRSGRLSLGLVVPIETYTNSPAPTMEQHSERVRLVESLGFAAVWLRDVPFNVPSFGDAGQIFDPFVYLGLLSGLTERIALGVASTILPLRHPAHIAKAAASVDHLSGGRLILGIASGDRPEEYPAMGLSFTERSARFRESYDYIRRMSEPAPTFTNIYGNPSGGMDMLPKPVAGRLPVLITGGSQQSDDWIAQHGDGWMLYPRNADLQSNIIEDWRSRIEAKGGSDRPVMEPLYVDLADDPNTPPQHIHLGLRVGTKHLHRYLQTRQDIGVNHVALNLRCNRANIETTLKRLADNILPDFHS